MEHVLITGGSGLVGMHLTKLLLREGYEVSHLGRRQSSGGIKTFQWDISNKKIEVEAIAGVDHVIHLAGANVAGKRWTASYKKEIIDSRVQSANLLYDSMRQIPNRVKTFISASAVGYYGNRGDEWLTEDDEPSNDFFGTTCVQWESAAKQFQKLNKRVVIIRTGIVLSKNGGALPSLLKPLHFGIAPIFGSGKQYYSWIHVEDLCRMYLFAIRNEQVHETYNGVAPSPERFIDLINALAETLHRKKINVTVPLPLLKLLIGEMAEGLYQSDRCASKKIEAEGFTFLFPALQVGIK